MTIVAQIHLYDNQNGRKTPFLTGYRPLFNLHRKSSKVSGMIKLLNMDKFIPGDTGIVEIKFLDNIVDLRDIRIGEQFTFDEGQSILGEGKILKLGNVSK
jgi:translation elongation factor EF-Tu-like GTPase